MSTVYSAELVKLTKYFNLPLELVSTHFHVRCKTYNFAYTKKSFSISYRTETYSEERWWIWCERFGQSEGFNVQQYQFSRAGERNGSP